MIAIRSAGGHHAAVTDRRFLTTIAGVGFGGGALTAIGGTAAGGFAICFGGLVAFPGWGAAEPSGTGMKVRAIWAYPRGRG